MTNRIIKFRGFNKDVHNEWQKMEGNLSILYKKLDHVDAGYYISNKAGMPFAYKVRPETVGQFAGLFDKNGKPIYEGDVVEVEIEDGDFIGEKERRSVIFERGKFTTDGLTASLYSIGLDFDSIEVIGNIYENPELLKTN